MCEFKIDLIWQWRNFLLLLILPIFGLISLRSSAWSALCPLSFLAPPVSRVSPISLSASSSFVLSNRNQMNLLDIVIQGWHNRFLHPPFKTALPPSFLKCEHFWKGAKSWGAKKTWRHPCCYKVKKTKISNFVYFNRKWYYHRSRFFEF